MSRVSAEIDAMEATERAEIVKQQRNDRIRLEELEDVTLLMSTKSGRRFVARVLEDTGVYRVSYTPNAQQTAHNEGNRRVGVDLRDLIRKHCPTEFLLMEQESLEREER